MRRINAILSMGILALFLVHGALGGFQLAGIVPGGSVALKFLAWSMTALIGLHTIIGIKLTADTMKAIKKSGASYFKDNKLFWLRRISGFAIMVFILFHVAIFIGSTGVVYRLNLFQGMQLVSQILLVISIALHTVSNVRPMMLSFGIKSYKELGLDIALVLSALLLFMGAAFIVYYLRWNVF